MLSTTLAPLITVRNSGLRPIRASFLKGLRGALGSLRIEGGGFRVAGKAKTYRGARKQLLALLLQQVYQITHELLEIRPRLAEGG